MYSREREKVKLFMLCRSRQASSDRSCKQNSSSNSNRSVNRSTQQEQEQVY